MPLSIPNVRFELSTVYRTYAEQILHSGSVSNILLKSTNLDSAGEQVETSLRILLQQLLPERVSVTHGHIVDQHTQISNQQDVLIAESFYTKSLIRTLDGTEFFPIEAIFATGEVKKTWSQKKLTDAVKSINRIKNELKRNDILPNQIVSGSKLVTQPTRVTKYPKRNPFFCFTFSLDFDKTYSENKLGLIYKNPKYKNTLPNIAIVLQRGIYVLVDEHKLNKGEVVIKLYPEFVTDQEKCRWVLLKLSPAENLAYLIFTLTQHINETVLEKATAMHYAKEMIEISRASISPL